MNKLKFKVGDTIIGVDNDYRYPNLDIIGKIGKITKVLPRANHHYRIKFEEQIDFSYDLDEEGNDFDLFKEYQLANINQYKLKKLLQE